MQSEAQRKAKATYQSKLKAVKLTFYPADFVLWSQLEKQTNKSGYIKNLIKQDIQKDGK